MSGPARPGAAPRVALVHDAFTQRGGAERVTEHLAGLLGAPRVFAAVADPRMLPPTLAAGRVATTVLQPLWRAGVPLQAFAPVLPGAFGALDLGRPEVVVSSSAAFAHHVQPPPGVAHVCYCHTPPRFLWEPDEYFARLPLARMLGAGPLHALRAWDRRAAARVTAYVANSAFTADRIRRTYGRDATVVYPPIDCAAFRATPERSGRFLVVARLRPHKRLDLAIAAAGRLAVGLDIIGEGSDRTRLERLAGPGVRFLGRRSDAEVAAAMALCAGLLVPGIEDFGMTTAEVQAAGRPPVAFARGGSLEIVRDGATGFLYGEPTVEALAAAMGRALRQPLAAPALQASAARFAAPRFDAAITRLVAGVLAERRSWELGPIGRSDPVLEAPRPAAVGDPVP